VLLGKCTFSNLAIGKARIKSGGRPPEDTSLFAVGAQDFTGDSKTFSSPEAEKRYKAAEMRAVRLVANDHENIPIGLFAAFSSLLFGKSPIAHTILLGAFAVGRVMHTIAYMNAR